MKTTMHKKPVNPKLPAPYNTMTASQLEAETAKFDKEFAGEAARPLSPAQRSALRRARRKRGRPKVGAGSQKIHISVERDLLQLTDARAAAESKSRSEVIAEALRSKFAGTSRSKSA